MLCLRGLLKQLATAVPVRVLLRALFVGSTYHEGILKGDLSLRLIRT